MSAGDDDAFAGQQQQQCETAASRCGLQCALLAGHLPLMHSAESFI